LTEIKFILFSRKKRPAAEMTAHRNFVVLEVIKEARAIGYGFEQVRENSYEHLPPGVEHPPLDAVALMISKRKHYGKNVAFSREKTHYKEWLASDIDRFRTKIQAGKF